MASFPRTRLIQGLYSIRSRKIYLLFKWGTSGHIRYDIKLSLETNHCLCGYKHDFVKLYLIKINGHCKKIFGEITSHLWNNMNSDIPLSPSPFFSTANSKTNYTRCRLSLSRASETLNNHTYIDDKCQQWARSLGTTVSTNEATQCWRFQPS